MVQVDVLLAELLRRCQLAEEYNGFMLTTMREGGQLTAARETSFRYLRGGDGGGMLFIRL